MEPRTQIFENELRISQEFTAKPEAVFDCWFEACKVFDAWCHTDCESVRVEIEPHAGGTYKRFLDFGDPAKPCCCKTFVEFDPACRIVYEGNSFARSDFLQRVSVDFELTNNTGTLVTITQIGASPSDKLQDAMFGRTSVLICTEDYDLKTNRDAWLAVFDRLEALLQT